MKIKNNIFALTVSHIQLSLFITGQNEFSASTHITD